MQNFRKNKAYRLSLYLILLIPALAVIVLLVESIPTNRLPIVTIFTNHRILLQDIISLFFIISIPLVFLGALSLRFISSNPYKRWKDIVLLLLTPVLEFFIITSTQIPDKCGFYAGPVPVDTPHWTLGAMFDICSSYNIFTELQVVAIVLFIVSLFLTLWYLISDIKKSTINAI